MHLKPSEANIQLHIVISTGGTLHTQHRKYRRLLCRIHQWIPRCCERVPTFKKAPNIHCLLNLSYRILNELPLVLRAGIGHLRINIQKQQKTQNINSCNFASLFAYDLYTNCEPEGKHMLSSLSSILLPPQNICYQQNLGVQPLNFKVRLLCHCSTANHSYWMESCRC